MTYQELKKEILHIARADNSCKDGYREALEAQTLEDMIQVWRHHWADVVGQMHYERAIEFLNSYYNEHRAAFAKAGFYYNCAADSGLVVLHNAKDIVVGGTAEVYAFGSSVLKAEGQAVVHAKERAQVMLHEESAGYLWDNTKAEVYDKAKAKATDYAQVSARSHQCRILADTNATVDATAWRRIEAYGNAHVLAHCARNIETHNQARLTLRS